MKNLNRQIKETQKTLNELYKKQTEASSRKLIKCSSCNKRTKISNLVFNREHFYVEPYGCTDGDYWNESKSNHNFKCPKCKVSNRILPDKIINLQDYFKKIRDCYDDSLNGEWVNY